MSNTTHRTVRIADDLWAKAQQVAAERSETVTDVIRRALATYTDQDN